MELHFFGTGTAFAGSCFNASFVVDSTVLVDCGAPVHHLNALLPHSSPIETVVITHFHADHTYMLPHLLGYHLAHGRDDAPLTVVGPSGIADYTRRIVSTGFGSDFWVRLNELRTISFIELQDGASTEVGTMHIEAVATVHSLGPSLMYCFTRPGDPIRLGVTGDTTLCPGLDALAAMSDVLVCECSTSEIPAQHGHLNHLELAELIARHPQCTVLMNHYDSIPSVAGARLAQDGATYRLGVTAGTPPRITVVQTGLTAALP